MENQLTELTPSPHPRKIYSVSQVNKIARATLENFSGWVHGEVSELKEIKTKFGNFYLRFNLKDEVTEYILPVICWSEVFGNLEFKLKNGLAILVFGNLTLWEKVGNYQFQAQLIELFGEGLLAAKLEVLKRKLASEGLFDKERKKEIPKYPTKIGVITRFESDAWFDFKKHTIDLFPFFGITLADVFVQGENAISDIVAALNRLNTENLEVIVLTRGGGSLEDLAPFNSEEIARAIAASQIPIISAIGHEKYQTTADLASDLAVSTPTAAAKLLTANFEEFLVKSDQFAKILKSLAKKFYQNKVLEISLLENSFEDSVKNLIVQKQNQLESFGKDLKSLPFVLIEQSKKTFANLGRELELLSPQRILERGYSVAYRIPDGAILKRATDVKTSGKVRVRLAKGELKARVFEVTK